jgi:acyl-CoA reductase-like NAD-dependent aldehyde dehydrogenase
MREIGSLRRKNPDAVSFAIKAHTLLTRDWGKASWHERENILQTVNWLLRMEKAALTRLSVPDRS